MPRKGTETTILIKMILYPLTVIFKTLPRKGTETIQDGALSPRTLKLAVYGQDTWALGLCRLEEAKGC